MNDKSTAVMSLLLSNKRRHVRIVKVKKVSHGTNKKGRRYDWLKWFSQSSFKLYRDKDYNGLDWSFAQYIRRAAKVHGYKVRVVIGEGSVSVVVKGQCEPCPEVHTNKYRRKK